MTIDYSGNGYTSPDFLTGPSPGELVSASSIGVPLQQSIDLLDTKANLTGADFTGAVTATNSTADPGIEATGGAGAAGGSFIGGTGGAPGVIGVGTTNAAGVTGTGNGSGAGGTFTGGASGNGATATGGGAGAGLVATGGATGKGIVCDSGSSSVAALDVGTGNAIFTGTPLAASTDPGFNNYLSGANITKAWATISTDGSGNVTLLDNVNVASATVNGDYVEITFSRPFASVNYCPVVSSDTSNGWWAVTDYVTRSTTTVRIYWKDGTAAGVEVDPAANPVRACIIVEGRQ